MSAKAVTDRPSLVILIAEDDANDVLLLRRSFAKSGVSASLHFVSNGEEAISYLKGEPPFDNRGQCPYPNVVLLDLNMPAVSGLDVLEWLAAQPDRASLVVVVFSSCMAPADCRQAVMLGAHSCMLKPLDPSALLPMLAQLADPYKGEPPVRSGELPAPGSQ
jgi:CheY-like chemotaxis protein